jgi:hypothetical protein
VSDQDFFFDEDETPAEKPAKADKSAAPAAKAGTKRPTASKSAAPRASASKAAPSGPAQDDDEAVPFTEQTVTVLIAGLLMVISLLIGAIIGFLLGGTSAGPAVSSVPEAAAPAGGSTDPGPLTNEQIQGGMPAGHPAIGATDSAGATAAP